MTPDEFQIKTVKDICDHLDAMAATVGGLVAKGSKGEGAMSQMLIKIIEAKQWGLSAVSTIHVVGKDIEKKDEMPKDVKKTNG